MLFQFALSTLLAVALIVPRACADEPPTRPSGEAVIRAAAGDSEIVIRTTSRLAGAIHSLTWRGKEFIDSVDHGRQLQSAASFDCAAAGPFWAECYNPTEAGSRHDGAGPTSTSQLLAIEATERVLTTKTQMAFWLRPGDKSEGRPAKNSKLLSDHIVRKKVQIGYGKQDQLLHYTVVFTLPPGERHTLAQYEALTGYMPAEFDRPWGYDPRTEKLVELTKVNGEQPLPVILSTADGKFAMGVYSPEKPRAGYAPIGYGRFHFPREKVNKWNCVFRIRDKAQVPAGEYAFQMFVPIGTLEEVRETMGKLHGEEAEKNSKQQEASSK